MPLTLTAYLRSAVTAQITLPGSVPSAVAGVFMHFLPGHICLQDFLSYLSHTEGRKSTPLPTTHKMLERHDVVPETQVHL